jgi:hypothetical protein
MISSNTWLLAIGAIVIIVAVYEINPKIGVGLTVLALMGMVYNYVRRPDFINPKRV